MTPGWWINSPASVQTLAPKCRLRSRATSRPQELLGNIVRPPPPRSRPGGRADGLYQTRSAHQPMGGPLPRPHRAPEDRHIRTKGRCPRLPGGHRDGQAAGRVARARVQPDQPPRVARPLVAHHREQRAVAEHTGPVRGDRSCACPPASRRSAAGEPPAHRRRGVASKRCARAGSASPASGRPGPFSG